MTLPVSVVLPVRNGERFVTQALRSVLMEDVAQIIVVDDHSTDDSARVAGEFLHPTLVPSWMILDNSISDVPGVGSARNLGIGRATEPWIALIDADDIWVRGKTEKQLTDLRTRGLLGHTNAFTSSLVEHFVEPGHEVPETLRQDKLGTIPLFFPSNLLCHREVFERVGGFNPGLVCANDVDWYRRASALGVTRLHLEEVLVRKRVHDQNLSLCQGHDMQKQILQVLAREPAPGMFPIW
jgi:glycosyltransferase involved in cell wall biosynthesis